MNKSVPIDELNSFVNEMMVFLSIARDSDLQKEACRKLAKFLEKLKKMKERAIEDKDEDRANMLLGFECVTRSLKFEISMWILLKLERPESAWNFLVLAQNSASAAARAHQGFGHLESHYARLCLIEEVVFPPQVFISSGLIASRQFCSICGSIYGECDHLAMMPYMGQFCAVVPDGLMVDHVAFVEHPADKRCRVRSFQVNGGSRNRMTWKIEKNTESIGDDKKDGLTAEIIAAVARADSDHSGS